MNVYDFDKTVYSKDSSIDFYLYNLKQDLTILRFLPKQLVAFVKYKTKRIPKTQMKIAFYAYLTTIDDLDERVKRFWDSHKQYVQPFYLAQKQKGDVIISASPTFLLQPIADEWGAILIASEVDPKTGHSGENCWGPEKVRRFAQRFDLDSIDEFYSDSLSDTPLASHAKAAFLVTGTKITPWPKS